MITGIAHVAYAVDDLEATLHFYCTGLGMREAFRLYDDNGQTRILYVQVRGSDFIEFFPRRSSSAPVPTPAPGRGPSFRHIALAVDDMEATLMELAHHGIQPEKPAQMGNDRNWQAWLVDPDGNRIELMEISPESPQHRAAVEQA